MGEDEKEGELTPDELELMKNYEIDLGNYIPGLGKHKIKELEQYLDKFQKYFPVYLHFRKGFRKELPKWIDEGIMSYAVSLGLVEKELKPRGILEYDIPMAKMQENMAVLRGEGWSVGQIASKLDIYPTEVSSYVSYLEEEEERERKEKERAIKKENKMVAWLKRKLRR